MTRPSAAHRYLRKSFTLIEMLVVITIIGILAALITGPVMNSVRSAASTSCKNNLHQAGVGLTTYVNEKERYPQAANLAISIPTSDNMPSISDALVGYVDAAVFKCPADSNAYYGYNGTSHEGKTLFAVDKTSYDWNFFLNNQSKVIKRRNGAAADIKRVWFLFDTLPNHGTEQKVSDNDDVTKEEVDSANAANENVRNIGYLDLTANGM